MNVGAHLQAIRKAKGLSQRELAKRVGVTNSTISLIEQNKVSPSIGSLKKVLDGIPISLAEFFTQDPTDASDTSPFYAASVQPDMGSAGLHYFLVGQRFRGRQMCVLREVLPPRSDTGEDLVQHAGEEGGVVVQGEVEITVGEHRRVLGPGEGYYFDCRTPHRFRNVGDVDSIIISASTPLTF